MSLNNKYGKCCKCPARVNLGRELTEYRSASIYNQADRIDSGSKTIYEYDNFFETNGKELLEKKQQYLRDNNICKNTGNNIFFIDSTDFHARFTEINNNMALSVSNNIIDNSDNINNNINNINNINNNKNRSHNCDDDTFHKDKDIWKKLKELEYNLHMNNIMDKKSACFWCTHDFDNPPIFIPKHYLRESYHVYGCFCTPECAAAHLMSENIDSSVKFERYHLLNHIYSKIYDYNKNIKPAPDPHYMLERYYGNLSIQEYRALTRSERLFLIVDKPLTRIMPELHQDNDDFIINSTIIPASTNYKVKRKIQKKGVQTKSNIMNENFGIVTN